MKVEFKACLWIDSDDDELFTNKDLHDILQEAMDTVCISVDNVEILSQTKEG